MKIKDLAHVGFCDIFYESLEFRACDNTVASRSPPIERP